MAALRRHLRILEGCPVLPSHIVCYLLYFTPNYDGLLSEARLSDGIVGAYGVNSMRESIEFRVSMALYSNHHNIHICGRKNGIASEYK